MTPGLSFMISNRSGNYYHFVDGADGGYALAALAMKAQLKSINLSGQVATSRDI